MCYSQETFKTCIKSWISLEKSLVKPLSLIKKLGLNHILMWILSYEKKQRLTLRNKFSNWWVIKIMENIRNHRDVKLLTT